MNRIYSKLLVHRIIEGPKDFKLFEVIPSDFLQYEAGQYVTLVHFNEGEEFRRSYSLASAPLLGEPMLIGVKRVANGFYSRLLVDHLRIGDELLTSGTGGRFVLPEYTERIKRIMFFAAGSGIIPVFSLLKTLLHIHPHICIHLIYSNASPEKTIFLHELKALEEKFMSVFRLTFLFSNQKQLEKARLNRDLLLSLLDTSGKFKEKHMLYYVCGPEAYNRMVSFVLQEQGIDPDNIKKEHFWLPAPAFPSLPPDKEDRNIDLLWGDEHYQFTVSYPETILKAAKRNRIILPYSCEAGRCGNCTAICTRGKVWHSVNEVLTDKELQDGLILTCTGHPVESDLEIRI